MIVEKEFGVQFGHLRPHETGTVGSLWDQVSKRLPNERSGDIDEGWERYRRLVAQELGVPLARVTREARFDEDLGIH